MDNCEALYLPGPGVFPPSWTTTFRRLQSQRSAAADHGVREPVGKGKAEQEQFGEDVVERKGELEKG